MANHVTSYINFENLSDKAEEFLENMNEETLLQGLYSDYDNTYDWYIDNVGAKWLTVDDINSTNISCTSAWSPPVQFYDKLHEKLVELNSPDAVVWVTYEDEMPNFAGGQLYIDGELEDYHEEEWSEILEGIKDFDTEAYELMLKEEEGEDLTQEEEDKLCEIRWEAIAESMVDIRNIMNRIDGVNVPTNEMNELADDEKMEFTKLLLDMSVIKDRIERLSVDDDAKKSAIQSLKNAEEALVALDETADYEPFPEGDEFNIEEDEDFEEVLGPLGFPEDETELFDAEYQGRKVPLNKPMRGDVKKFKVYVKDPKTGNVKKVNFGHGGTSAKRPTMRIRKSNPKARKSFRARHNCANPGPKTKARYWSCRKW